MKKIIISAFIFFLALTVLLSSCESRGADGNNPLHLKSEEPTLPMSTVFNGNTETEMRAVWIATAWNINFPSAQDLTENQLKSELDEIVKTAKEAGMNSVFFQVRSFSDALYDSDIFPIAKSLSSKGKLSLDCLEYLIQIAHSENISVHAWINPLRISSSVTDTSLLPDSSPAKTNPDMAVSYAGGLWLNCGLPEVRSLVCDGIKEITDNYDVDGIVFDDYFYPYPSGGESFADTFAYGKYNINSLSLDDFRRESVNRLVKDAYETVKTSRKDCKFGVAPFGIVKNITDGEKKTNGFESYYSIYCDPIAWMQGNYVDYVAPQIYWNIGYEIADFSLICDWWNVQAQIYGTDLYITHGIYRVSEYGSSEEFANQLDYASKANSYKGSTFFGYEDLKNNTLGIKDVLSRKLSQTVLYTDILPENRDFSLDTADKPGNSYSLINGICNPAYPLYCDGIPIPISKNGEFCFSHYFEKGENKLTFSQNGILLEYSVFGK